MNEVHPDNRKYNREFCERINAMRRQQQAEESKSVDSSPLTALEGLKPAPVVEVETKPLTALNGIADRKPVDEAKPLPFYCPQPVGDDLDESQERVAAAIAKSIRDWRAADLDRCE